MKTILFKSKLLFLLGVMPIMARSQTPATGPTIANGSPVPVKADHAWYRGGNIAGGAAGNKNIFGFTTGNLPIYTQTNGAMRTKLNGTFIGVTQYAINGFGFANGVNTSGYFLLGVDYGPPVNSFYNTRGAFSLLHLNGNSTNTAAFVQDGGYRPWMKTGITFTDNQDRAYVGYRSNGLDISDFIINWSDNSVGPFPGPDNLLFNFSAGTGTNPGGIDGNQANGREVVRMTGYGNVGIGPRFDNTQVPIGLGQGQPQSLLHLNINDNWASWMQITNQATGQTLSDGLRIGLVGAIQLDTNPLFVSAGMNANATGTAMIYNQENRPLLFSTNANTNSFLGNNASNERVRIMAAGTITQLNPAGAAYLVYNPAGINPNYTRISISHNPSLPVTRPLSLLHLGYNSTPFTNDGWRPWMDVGTYYAQETDNMYVGLLREGTNFSDAVVSWGNEPSGVVGGPNRLRFIFTRTSGAPGNAGGLLGLEIARMWSDGNEGRTGFGNFQLLGIEPQNTVHINSVEPDDQTPGGGSGLRFEDITILTPTINNPGPGVLTVDANGDVIYVDGGSGLGNLCGAAPNPLSANYEINNNSNNLYLTGPGITNFGDVPCGITAPARVFVRNTFQIIPQKVAFYVEQNGHPSANIAGQFMTNGTTDAYGIWASAPVTPQPNPASFPLTAALYADGDVIVTGTPYLANPGVLVSDQQFKNNVDTISNALSLINNLNPVTYNYDTSLTDRLHFNTKLNYGFIAQEVEQVIPDLVSNGYLPAIYDSIGNITSNSMNFKTLNYNGLFSILTKGIQEQQNLITNLENELAAQDSINTSLQDQINTLYGMITSCCSNNSMVAPNNSNNSQSVSSVELSDAQTIVLDQNVPNPFSEMTTITYSLTDGVHKAQILFYNLEGKLINSLDISNQSGKGQVNVFANDLSTGVYTYTLVVDGKIIDTKKMVKQ